MNAPLLPCYFEKFAKAGHAIFTLVGKTSRYTYQIVKKETEGRPPIWFVSVLTGPNNTSDYQYIGELVFNGSTFRPGKPEKVKVSADAPSVKAFAWTWNKIVTQKAEQVEHLEIWHVGKCGKCGRPLTTPESLTLGLGPICSGA